MKYEKSEPNHINGNDFQKSLFSISFLIVDVQLLLSMKSRVPSSPAETWSQHSTHKSINLRLTAALTFSNPVSVYTGIQFGFPEQAIACAPDKKSHQIHKNCLYCYSVFHSFHVLFEMHLYSTATYLVIPTGYIPSYMQRRFWQNHPVGMILPSPLLLTRFSLECV